MRNIEDTLVIKLCYSCEHIISSSTLFTTASTKIHGFYFWEACRLTRTLEAKLSNYLEKNS